MKMTKQFDVYSLVRNEDWLLRDVDVYARSALKKQSRPVRLISRRALFVNRIGWLAIISFFAILSGCVYVFYIRFPSIVSGSALTQRGGWIFIGSPIILALIVLMLYITVISDYMALKYGVLGLATFKSLSKQPKNAVIDGSGEAVVRTGLREFIATLKSRTLNSEWMSQVMEGDSLIVLIDPNKDVVLADYGPVTSDDIQIIREAFDKE